MLRTQRPKEKGDAWWRTIAHHVQRSVLLTLAPFVSTILLSGFAYAQQSVDWARAATPSPHGAEAIGKYNAGCLAGGVAVPLAGLGFQLTDVERNRRWAHPDMADYIQDLGRRVAAAGLGMMTVEDISQPRGGPMPSGHRSHQMGLDADIWYRLGAPPSPADSEQWYMVPAGSRDVDPRVWTERQAELLRLAASDPRVSRIFVNPGVKQALCDRQWPDRAWLKVIRPWFAHAAHFHVRLHCPPDSPGCEPQETPPDGDGCGDELASWFRPAPTPAKPAPPYVPPPLPVACAAVLSTQ